MTLSGESGRPALLSGPEWPVNLFHAAFSYLKHLPWPGPACQPSPELQHTQHCSVLLNHFLELPFNTDHRRFGTTCTMLLLVIAIAAVQLFAAVLATFDMPATKSDSDPSYGTLHDGTRLVCRGSDTMPAKNIDFLEDKVTSFRLSRETDYHIPLPSGYCAQIRCDDATAILYCNNVRTAHQTLLNRAITDNIQPMLLAMCIRNHRVTRAGSHRLPEGQRGSQIYRRQLQRPRLR